MIKSQMKIGIFGKSLTGILIIIPYILFALMFAFMFSGEQKQFVNSINHEPTQTLKFIFLLTRPVMLIIVGLIIFFTIFVYRSGRVPKEKRGLWTVVLIALNVNAFPFFWYWYIFKEKHVETKQ